jgi:hypothetical protein
MGQVSVTGSFVPYRHDHHEPKSPQASEAIDQR